MIYKLLDLTTGHLPERERRRFPDVPTFVWGCTVVPTEHGWFISVPSDDNEGDCAGMPYLHGIIRHARTLGAIWILLDCDAEHEHGLPSFDDTSDAPERDCTHPACVALFPPATNPHRSRLEIRIMPEITVPPPAPSTDTITLDREQVEAILKQIKSINIDTSADALLASEAIAPLIEFAGRFRTEVQALADRLFQLRGDYQPGGDKRAGTKSATLSAAILESFGSFLACVAGDDTEGAIEGAIAGLTANLVSDLARGVR